MGHRQLEPRSADSVGDIESVEPNVIILPKALGTFLGRGNRLIFEGGLQAGVRRELKDGEPTGCQNPEQLRQRPGVVIDVLEHVAAENEGEAAVFKRQVGGIGLDIYPGRVQVRCHTGALEIPGQPPRDALLGSEMQHGGVFAGQVTVLGEVVAEITMAGP